MKGFFVLFLICHVAHSAPHSLWFILSATSESSEMPEFLAGAVVDGVDLGQCNSNRKSINPNPSWMRKLIEDKPQHHQWLSNKCLGNLQYFRATITSLMQRFNQSEGIHTFQRMNGCYLDDQTGDYNAFNQYGYDGQDLISFDLKTMTWITPRHQTLIIKQNWDRDGYNQFWKFALTEECKYLLQLYLTYGKKDLETPVPPSVSLLQKTPSSPVTCHATGFYPDRAEVFWRKDGEEIHDDVYKWEILPNNDGTFQMSIELNISLISPEDWRKYDCVFQLSGLEDSITVRLDRSNIATNFKSSSGNNVAIICGIVLVVLAVIVTVIIIFLKKNRDGSHSYTPTQSHPPTDTHATQQ